MNINDEQTRKQIDEVLSQIDFSAVTRKDVIADLVSNTRAIAFRLLVGSALLEEIDARESANPACDATEKSCE